MTLSGVITPGQSGLGSNGNKGVLCIPQSSSLTEASPSDSLISYPGKSYLSAEIQLVYSTALVNWAPRINLSHCHFYLGSEYWYNPKLIKHFFKIFIFLCYTTRCPSMCVYSLQPFDMILKSEFFLLDQLICSIYP